LQIYASKLGGDVAIVNGLNHYIGMRTLHEADFPEFTYLPWILGFFAALCLAVAVSGSRKMLFTLLGLYLLFAVLAMVDFWRWEYNYGHNLDPTAPIQVPGMSYQPPLIGYKQLLNFGAYSIPDIGGWLMAGAGAIIALLAFLALRNRRIGTTATLVSSMLILSSCAAGPVPIKLNVDNCHSCRMTIADARFGAEVLSRKGKTWKFDDTHCLQAFLKSGELAAGELKEIYFVRYDDGHELLPSQKALLLQSEAIHSPMGGNVAAFADKAGLDAAAAKFGGSEITWQALKQ
jgi:copper chaperone NosL